MKILYLHQYFNTPAMSGGTRSYEMARRLAEAGHEVQMVTSDTREGRVAAGRWHQSIEGGIHVHWLAEPYSNRMSYAARVKAFGRFAWRAARRAAAIPADVVFATSTPLTIAIPAVYAKKRQRIPMVFEVRDLWPELPIAVGALRDPVTIAAARWLERYAYRHASRVVALSPGMRDGVVRTGYPADRVAVIPNACDLSLFDVPADRGKQLRLKYNWLGDRPMVLYAGTLGIINGIEYFARLAAATLPIAPALRFVVVGSGHERGPVERTARELGVFNENFFMLDAVAKREIPDWFSAATVVTSLFVDIREMWANSANKFFDGLAAGKPVAINYHGWQAELLTRHTAGIVLDVQDVNRAAASLVKAVDNLSWLEQAGMNARSLARTEFDRDSLARRLEEVLADAVQNPARRRN